MLKQYMNLWMPSGQKCVFSMGDISMGGTANAPEKALCLRIHKKLETYIEIFFKICILKIPLIKFKPI